MLRFLREEHRVVNKKQVPFRVYENTITSTEVCTYLLHTDRAGHRWYTFEDLFAIPFMRQLAAKKVVDLYGHDLTLADITAHMTQLKALLRSAEPDKYERCYAKVLELETLAGGMADPVKQCIGLCTVYLLLDDEQPDTYNQSTQNVKLTVLSLDLDAQSFFLNWWTEHMRHSGQLLKALSRIASTTSAQ
jgi:hypothetical protein